jgi:3-oxoacyl-[acyl-carrier-protein] synthase-3
MGTRIEAVATAVDRGRLHVQGARHLSDLAATACLRRAGRAPDQLDLIVNAGLYKDANAAEPALATIIQEDIGANPDSTLAPRHGTFSFDVLDGGCGVVTAARLLASFVGHGTAEHGLIVAGDVDPSPRTSRHFPFVPAAGAILVGHVNDGAGFVAFESRTFPADAELFEVTLRWEPRAGLLRRGRNIVDVREDPRFAPRCLELATEVAADFLQRHHLAPGDVDLLITSQYPRRVSEELGSRLGIEAARVPRVRPELSYAHTAGPIAALEVAFESGQLARAHDTLFVTVGAGITVGVALYRGEVA